MLGLALKITTYTLTVFAAVAIYFTGLLIVLLVRSQSKSKREK